MFSKITTFLNPYLIWIVIGVALLISGLIGYNKILSGEIKNLEDKNKILLENYNAQKEAADLCSANTKKLKEAEDAKTLVMVKKVEEAKVKSDAHVKLADNTLKAPKKPVIIPLVPQGTSQLVLDNLKDYLETQDVINSYIDAKVLLEQMDSKESSKEMKTDKNDEPNEGI